MRKLNPFNPWWDQWAIDHPWQAGVLAGVLFFVTGLTMHIRGSILDGVIVAIAIVPVFAWMWGRGPARKQALKRIARRSSRA